jgi:hypothetical protein
MTFGLVLLFTVLASVSDLVSAWLYAADPLHWGIDVVRHGRDGLMAVLALWGLRHAHRTGSAFVFALLYAGWIAVYALASPDGPESPLILASSAKLALPVLLLAAGYGSVDTPERLRIYALTLAALAVLSTGFGAWDIGRTEFWTETLQYGHYLNGVKGIVMGFDGYYTLPFNFFGFEEKRRAAGLVAAPLAQGSLVATGSLLGFAALQRRAFLPAAAILVVGLLGVWQSGTRGAMLFLLIALPIFLILGGRGSGIFVRNAVTLAALALCTFQAVAFVYSYSVNFQDGSTIGHLEALERNIADLDQVLVIGAGIGAAGSVAADEGLETAGGGEGALFSIIYQIGLPGGLVFLLFYAAVLRRAFAARHPDGAAGDIGLAVFALGIGVITSFISSDHIFSLSGMGVFWIALGGVLAQARGARP